MRQKEMETYPFCRRNDLLVYYFKIFHIILYRAREMYMIITTMCRYVPMLLEEISMTACGLWIDNRYSIDHLSPKKLQYEYFVSKMLHFRLSV